ncbi:distal tail protein Dit [Priestia megaterium]|uniref:distal tail protein Dit n=1 Tax=Priestia megaterium TaxID=1404 RepID=UPI003CC5EE70
MNSLIKSFAGLSCPAFLIVQDIKTELLPPISVSTLDLPKKDGQYYVNSKFGIRTFDVEIAFLTPKKEDVLYYADDLAEWLYYDEPQKLIFRDKPDIYYMAKVVGNTELEKVYRSGKATIQFVCYDPHGYSVNEKAYTFNPTSTDPVPVINNGNMEASPTINVTFTKNVTDFAIVTDKDTLYFGEPFDSTIQKAVDLQPKLINDTGASTTGWQTGLAVDGGDVAGTIISNGGFSFMQGVTDGKRDYGTGTKWHGGAIVKSVGAQVQDFICECQIGFDTTANNQFGRIEVYLLGANDEQLGKMALKDAHPTMKAPLYDCWIGKVNGGGEDIIKAYGAHYGSLDNFNGIMRVERIGKRWTFFLSKITNGIYHTRIFKQYVDWQQEFMQKVAKIQIHIGAYGTNPPVSNMWVSNVLFKEVKSKGENEIDYVFRTGDKLSVDCSTSSILLNNEPYFSRLYPSSTYPILEKGVNGISVNDPVIKDGVIKFRERWL